MMATPPLATMIDDDISIRHTLGRSEETLGLFLLVFPLVATNSLSDYVINEYSS